MANPVEYCPGCGDHSPTSWDLCSDCIEQFGTDFSSWPDWLQELVRDRRREYFAERRRMNQEIQSSDFIFHDGMGGVVDRDLMTRQLSDMAPSYGSERIMLPYAPYENEAQNRQYRQANGIAERSPIKEVNNLADAIRKLPDSPLP